MPRLKQAHFLWGGGIYFPSSLTLRYRCQVLALGRCLLFTFPLRQGPGFVSCPSVSLSFKAEAQCPQVQRKPYKWKLAFVFELLTCSHFVLRPAKFLTLLPSQWCISNWFLYFIQHLAFQLGKLLGIPNLPHSLNWKLLWWFQPILFLISVVTSRCFSPWVPAPASSRLCVVFMQANIS